MRRTLPISPSRERLRAVAHDGFTIRRSPLRSRASAEACPRAADRQAGDQDGFALKANVSGVTVELGYSECEKLRSILFAGGRPQLAETSIRR